MTIKVEWHDEAQTILRYDFFGVWSWEAFANVHSKAFTMMNYVDHNVNVMLNFNASPSLPTGTLSAIRIMLAYAPENMGLVVFTGGDEAANRTFSTLSKFDTALDSRLVTVETIADAEDVLHHHAFTYAAV